MRKVESIFVVVLMLSSFAGATTLQVGPGQTYTTVSAAYAAASDGDVINIHAGTYTSMPDLSGNGPENVTFQRNGTDKVVFDLSDKLYLRYDDNYTFDGIIFDARDADYAVYLRLDARHTTFKYCVFYGAGITGLYAYDGTGHWISDIKVEHCTFFDNNTGMRGAGNAYLGDSNGEIKDNLFVSNTTGIDNDGKQALTVNYSAFWNNTTNTTGNNTVTLGTGTLTSTQVTFASTDIANDHFLWLASDISTDISEGASDGSYMGAFGVVPEPATIGLLAFGVLGLTQKR